MWSPLSLYFCIRKIWEINPSIVFSWLHGADVVIGLCRYFTKNFKWIVAERDSSYPSEFKYWLRRFFCLKADCIVSNSRAGEAYWERAGFLGRKFVVRNILYKGQTNEGAVDSVRDIDVLYVGRLEAQKNIKLLFDVFSILSNVYKLKCVVVGDGSLSGIVSDNLDYSLIERFPFSRDVYGFYRRSKLFVSLSLHEGLPNVLIENLSIGNKVLVSDIREHKDVLGDNFKFYVPLQANPSYVVEKILCSLDSDSASFDYSFAKKQLAEMSPVAVCNSYIDVFNFF